MFLLGSIIFTVTLTILINVFFLKEKQRDWLAQYSTWAVLFVWLTLIPILIFHTEAIRHTFIFIQWCFIAPQGLGVYYQHKKYKVALQKLDDNMIAFLEEAIEDGKKNGATDETDWVISFKDRINEIKYPTPLWKKIKNKVKNIF